MKNKIKAAVSLLLSLLLALGCMGTSAFAADQNLGDITLKFSTKTGSITVEQNLNAVEQLGITGGPVAGVEYTLAQIGSLCRDHLRRRLHDRLRGGGAIDSGEAGD